MDVLKDNIKYSNEYDRLYNRIARDQSAYISLLFPLIYAIIYLNDTNSLGTYDHVIIYIFNSLVSLVLFLPALFFLYKQIIRGVSEIITEEFLFRLANPKYVPFRNNCLSISKNSKRKLGQLLKEKLKIDIQHFLESANRKRKNEFFKTGIKEAIIHIREIQNISKDNIVFEYNCIYGFFRNLVGGMAINLLIYYACMWCNVLSCSPIMESYYKIAVPTLWCFLVLFIIFAWGWRIKFYKRLFFKFMSDID